MSGSSADCRSITDAVAEAASPGARARHRAQCGAQARRGENGSLQRLFGQAGLGSARCLGRTDLGSRGGGRNLFREGEWSEEKADDGEPQDDELSSKHWFPSRSTVALAPPIRKGAPAGCECAGGAPPHAAYSFSISSVRGRSQAHLVRFWFGSRHSGRREHVNL
jgi:hypothetical protein